MLDAALRQAQDDILGEPNTTIKAQDDILGERTRSGNSKRPILKKIGKK
jgi:hypothetical protein